MWSLQLVLGQRLSCLPLGLASRKFWTRCRTNVAGISRSKENWFDIQGFTDFTTTHFVAKCHTENALQISHLCRLFFWQYSFSCHPKFMIMGEDRNNDRFKNGQFAVFESFHLWSQSDKAHAKLGFFTNLCINLLVLSSTTHEYRNVLKLLDLLQCIITYLQHILPWVSGET